MCRRLERFEQMAEADVAIAASIAGYHLEGPWLSPQRGYCGAHRAELMQAPTRENFDRLQGAAKGRVRLITLAPEWPSSMEFIALLTAAGVHVSLGHTDATEAQIDGAIRAGARFCTHLGNGVPLQLPRHDNIIQRLLARDELTACFIPDGVHVPPFALRNFVRAKPPGRVLFTTDAMAGAGAPPGRYSLGHLIVEIGADHVARFSEGGFAGSTLTPDAGVRRVASYLEVSPDVAHAWWSETPARAFGVKLPAET